MRERGVEEAIRAAGGIGALARSLGISQPSVSNWQRVPSERVLAVEALTGVGRSVLRPDLYPEEAAGETDEVEFLRARTYDLLALLLGRAPGAGLLADLAGLRGDAGPLGLATIALADAAAAADPGAVSREYFDLFVGVGRGELLPYGSYYLTGFLHERPLARVRQDLDRLGIERAEGSREPEDHLGTLCEVMAGLAAGRFEGGLTEQRLFFERHLKPWAGRFFSDLERARHARLYRPVGTIGRLFLDLEAQAFALEDA